MYESHTIWGSFEVICSVATIAGKYRRVIETRAERRGNWAAELVTFKHRQTPFWRLLRPILPVVRLKKPWKTRHFRNSREAAYNFQDCRLRPLGHPSKLLLNKGLRHYVRRRSCQTTNVALSREPKRAVDATRPSGQGTMDNGAWGSLPQMTVGFYSGGTRHQGRRSMRATVRLPVVHSPQEAVL